MAWYARRVTGLVFALLAQAPIADIPFERVGNRIYLKASLNGQKVNAILDSGAGATVADTEVATKAGANKLQEIVAGGAGANAVKAYVVSGLKLSLDGTEITHPIQVILPLAPMTSMEGRPLETILGYDFFIRYRVEIDYAAGRLRLFDAKDESTPAGASVATIDFQRNLPHIKGRVQFPRFGSHDVTMMLDTGATSAATLTRKFVKEKDFTNKFNESPEMVLGGGVGGETKGRRIRLLAATLGGTRVEKPVAVLESTEGGATGTAASYDVLIGGEMLRRFTVTFDYAHKRVFFKPNAILKEAFIGDRVGFAVVLGASGGYEVKLLVPSSPATEAGMVVGDQVLAVNDKTFASLDDLRRALRVVKGDVKLKIKRGTGEREIVLKSRELVP